MIKAPPVPTAPGGPKRSRVGSRIRTWFLTGIVVAGPLTVTVVLVLWFVDLVDNAVRKIVPSQFWPDTYLPFALPGFGVIFAFFGLTLLGFLAANLAGRTLISIGERILNRTPVIRSIYRSAKQIFETLFSATGTSLRRVGLVQFPIPGQWSIVFISAPPSALIDAHLPPDPDARISVFLPCAPNPTTGFYFYLPARDVIEVAMSPEEAAKLIMSCGVIQPEGQAALAALVESSQPTPQEAPQETSQGTPQETPEETSQAAPVPDRISSYG